jgi:YD repeat-containing protein
VRIALGRVGGREVAAVGVAQGLGAASATGYGLLLLDIADPLALDVAGPLAPQRLGYLEFPLADLPDLSDVVLDGDMAIVASRSSGSLLVNLSAIDRPYVAGRVSSLSGHLAVGDAGNYFSTGGDAYGSSTGGGLHATTTDQQCDLLTLRDELVTLDVVRDPDNGSLCGGAGVIVFTVCRASKVTLKIDGSVRTLALDDVPDVLLADVPLAPGVHVVTVPFGAIGTGIDTRRSFSLEARPQDVEDPQPVTLNGTIANKLINRSVLPVGHTFVKGVDLMDGHLVRQSTDVKIQGRHLGLEVTRTYSSASQSEDDVMGAGWNWNYASAVTPMSCGLVNVGTAEGISQVFRTTDGGATFTPQKGYHTKLEKLTPGEGYRFTDKHGLRHYFREPVDAKEPLGALRLDYVLEPHGDKLEVQYDLLGRVSSVREVLRDGSPVRSLSMRYERAAGRDRLSSVTSNLGHEVEYAYDAQGNLIDVKRGGANVGGQPAAAPITEKYEYLDSPRDRHQMTVAMGANNDRTEYAYYAAADTFPGEGNLSIYVSDKQEFVKAVTEIPGGTAANAVTGFSYDYTQVLTGSKFKATVTDARGNPTEYEMNLLGGATRVEEPPATAGGQAKVTLLEWAPNDIVKTKEADALGRVTRFEHTDGRGNLTAEQIEKPAGTVLARTEYSYDAKFNKLTWKKDAENRETIWAIDDQTGDIKETTDAAGNRTVFTYDGAGEGLLTNVKDPRGFDTASSDHNDYGTPTTIRKALSGHVAIDVYDSRNRLIERRDEYQGTVIRRQAAEYDGFDRAVIQERLSLSGQPASDQRTETEYYPGGQPRVVTNALGGKTTYTLDGMNRVIATSTTVGYNGEPPVTTAFEFDGVGNKVAETDRRGVRGIHAYDALNRLTQTQIASGIAGEGPTGVIATYGYDLVGNKLFETDVNSFQTDYVYDDLHRIKTKLLPQQMPAGLTPTGRLKEEYTYDKVGNLLTSTDAGAYVTTREYDALDRVTKVIRDPRAPNPAGLELITTTRYCNDPAATPIGAGVLKCEEHEEKHGRRTLFEYDALNRETLKTVRLEGQDGNPATNNVEEVTRTDYFDSDRAHQITEQLDATRNMVTRVQLDGLDREVKRIHDFGVRNEVTQTTYDGAGNKKLVLEPRSNPSSFTYDALGRLRLATDAKVQNGVYTYDGAGLKLSETDRRGVQKAFTYDNLARARKSGLAAAPFSGVTWNHEIQYVDGLQPQRREIDAKGNVTVFDLDGLGRVIKETDPDGKYVETTWDGVNKRRVRNKEGHLTTYDYDAVNRPVKTTDPAPYQGQTVETTYDDANNRVTEKDREGTLTITQMDPLGRAVTVTRDGVLLARNTYDFLGNKVLIEDGSGKKTQFSYDTANRLESRVDGYGTPEAKTTQYRYDLSGNKTKEIDALSTEAVPTIE